MAHQAFTDHSSAGELSIHRTRQSLIRKKGGGIGEPGVINSLFSRNVQCADKPTNSCFEGRYAGYDKSGVAAALANTHFNFVAPGTLRRF